ncbi:hypothetical protein [Amycolatopsis sp. H20-H5]|uniref:hypothetical protein n=1 Tax=Amycolatopsis sp. H20-H5 TaxID=3046309 RepID=UPI002DBB9103|nr:hypothetical protein [Amycolatopsis sp. H20-H5]MEC3982436.1 hypothetical protein [Amycolatopsis sp. H20-H5]
MSGIRAVPRVVLVELGADGSVGDATALGRLLRDDGVEVVYTGQLTTVEQIVATAGQEDPDVLGVVVAEGQTVSLAGLAGALPGIHLFALGSAPDGVETVFETASQVAEWLSGVRAHTPRGPSDRVR